MAKTPMELLKDSFLYPDSSVRTAPLWVWNDSMEPEQIDFILDELKSHGFGGSFIHPRPGLLVPYLSEEWFEKWNYALEASKKRDMKIYIYDENSYPSGFGGGHVPSELPDCLATSVRFEVKHINELPNLSGGKDMWFEGTSFVKVFACEQPKEGSLRLLKDVSDEEQSNWKHYGTLFCLCTFVEAKTENWLGGFANVDLLKPEVTRMFLSKVYEPYYKRFGKDFGEHIPAIFSDEPSLTGSNLYGTGGKNVLPFSYWFAYQFKKRNGYDLTDYLPALFSDTTADWFEKDDKKVRFDYYSTVQELFTDNFVKPIATWCIEHNIKWTGHYMEDDWPRAGSQVVSPSTMSNYEYMGWPAIDMIMNYRIIDKPNDILRLIMLEVRSAAAQLDKERVLCESFGAGGWDSTLGDFKKLSDWLMVNGINFINQHLTYSSLIGARKRDHPQSFDWREPWWDDYTSLNDYTARLCALLSQGKTKQRILVLHPTTTGYMRIQDDAPSNLLRDHLCENPNMQGYLDLLQSLSDNQWDYDLGDEFILKRNAICKAGKLQVGVQAYDLIIITEEMENMLWSTQALITSFMAQNGKVLSIGKPGNRLEGEENAPVYDTLMANEAWSIFPDQETLLLHLESLLPKRLQNSFAWPTGFEHMRREMDNTHTLYFFVNHSLQIVENEVLLEGESIELWDPWTGKQSPYPFEKSGNGIKIHMHLENFESQVFLVTTTKEKQKSTSAEDKQTRTSVSPFVSRQKSEEKELLLKGITPATKNVYPINYCTLDLDGKTYPDINTIPASKLIYKQRGFSNNPWDNAVQFKSRIQDCNRFEEGSGYKVTYSFSASADFEPSEMDLIVEYGEAYSVTLNGRSITWDATNTYLDTKNKSAKITGLVVPGKNTIELINTKFDLLYELEPIYIRGHFAVTPIANQWILTNPIPVTYGTWITQGYPFYEDAFEYTYEYRTDKLSAALLELPAAETTCMTLIVNGTNLGIAGINGNYKFDISPFLFIGTNIIIIKVCGGLKNLLGPHHDPSLPRKTAWPNMWRYAPKFNQPAPEQYDLIPYGLNLPIKLYS